MICDMDLTFDVCSGIYIKGAESYTKPNANTPPLI